MDNRDTWNRVEINRTTAVSNLANRLGTCPNTIDGLAAGSIIMWISVNGGDTSANDATLMATLNNFTVTVSGTTTNYQFQATAPTTGNAPVSALPYPTDDRIDPHIEAPVATYCRGESLHMYVIDPDTANGWLGLTVDIADVSGEAPESNTLIAERGRVRFFWLASGEWQVNYGPYGDRQEYELIWRGCPQTYTITHIFDIDDFETRFYRVVGNPPYPVR